MKSLAIIPARAGSKRLPNKNKKLLNGMPLIQYTIDAVLKSKIFDKIILSSNDFDIIAIGNHNPKITTEIRHESLSGDNVKVIDLVHSIIRREDINRNYDIVGLFLPTCPFRTAKHINEAMTLLKEDIFSVVSVTEMHDPVQLSLTFDDENTIDTNVFFETSPLISGETRSQDFQKYYRVNGGIYLSWIEKLIKKDNFFQGEVKAYLMDQYDSVDIDNDIDHKWAEFLMENNYVTLEENNC